MTFDVYPSASLALAPAADSGPVPLTPRFGAGGMTVRIVQIGSGPATPPPTLALRVGSGPLTTIAAMGATSLTASPDPAAPLVADVTAPVADGSVHRITIFPRDGQHADTLPWALRLTNADATGHSYRWVGADSDAESRQALIVITPPDPLETVPGAVATGAVTLANRGTGPLTITTPAGTDLGSGFTLTAVPASVPPDAVDHVTVTYTPPAGLPAGGTSTASTAYTLATNDPLAALPGHAEARFSITATTHPPRWKEGDVLVVDPDASVGAVRAAMIAVDPTGKQTIVSVGQHFVAPAGVTVDAHGDALVADPKAGDGTGAVIRVDRVTGAQTVLAAKGLFAGPTALVVTPAGGIVVLDPAAFGGAGGLITVDPDTGVQARLASGGQLHEPVDLAVDPRTGSVVVLNAEPSVQGTRLAVVTPQGQVTAFGSTPIALPALGVSGLAVDDDGRVLIGQPWIDPSGAKVIAIAPGGTRTVLASGPPLRFPRLLRRDGAGDVVVLDVPDPTAPSVVRIDADGGPKVTRATGGSLRRPLALTVVPAGTQPAGTQP